MNKLKINICNEIKYLDKNELYEIFNIIKCDIPPDKITENKNGIFINFKYVKDENVVKIWDTICWFKENKKIIHEQELQKQEDIKQLTEIISTDSDEILTDEEDNYELVKLENLKSDLSQPDKFKFQSYIDKLSINTNKNFENCNIDNFNIEIVEKNQKDEKVVSELLNRVIKNCKHLNNTSNNQDIEQLELDVNST